MSDVLVEAVVYAARKIVNRGGRPISRNEFVALRTAVEAYDVFLKQISDPVDDVGEDGGRSGEFVEDVTEGDVGMNQKKDQDRDEAAADRVVWSDVVDPE